MKSTLILTLAALLLSTSCGKNHILGQQADQLIFNTKSENEHFVLDSDPELRRQLLNSVVEVNLTPQSFDKNTVLPSNFLPETQSFRTFNESKKTSKFARLVVSYSDRLEVYQIPEKSDLNTIVNSLGLTAPKETSFSWVIKDDFAIAGKEYLLVNTGYEELMENDTYFYEEEVLVDNPETMIEVVKGAILNIEIDFKLYKQRVVSQKQNGATLKCSRDVIESTGCGCTFNMSKLVSEFEEIGPENLSLIDFDFKVNNKLVPFNKMHIDKIEDGKLQFNLEYEEAYDLVPTFQIAKRPLSVNEIFYGQNYDGNCRGGESNTVTRKIESKMEVKYKILGRGEKLREIIL